MDHSLVLFRRQMCWSLEDIAYYALKVNGKKKKPKVDDDVAKKIRALDWMDNMLYQHFNTTLWQKIEKEKGFFEELQQLQEMKAKLMVKASSAKYGIYV